jgi:hypothetical protein
VILSSTTQKLQVILGGAAATANSPVIVDYVESNSSAVTSNVVDAFTNGASAVDILAAPAASTQRKVTGLALYNADTAAISVSIRLNDNGSTYDIVSALTLQPGSALQFTREGGWNVVAAGGGVRDLRAGWVQEFKDSGTWYKPPNIRFVLVDCCGGGGGGGAGGGGASGVIICGGSGGGGGKRSRRLFLASDLPSSVAITVAAPAAGGVAVANSAGGSGSVGGNSSFGSYLIGYGGGYGVYGGSTGSAGGSGGGGTGAGTATGYGGPAMAATAPTGSYGDDRGGSQNGSSFLGGAAGGNARTDGTGSTAWGAASYFSGAGGGGGSSVTAANGVGGVAGAGGVGQINPIIYTEQAGMKLPGLMATGGAGGASRYVPSGNINGENGYPGGWPGGGGGGGGAAATGSGTATGGNGGNGGGGMVRVMGW